MHFAYLQDDFKVSSKLTLNLGVRYEFATPQWEDQNRLGNFDPATATLIQRKTARFTTGRWSIPTATTGRRDLASPTRHSQRLLLRGGYGISYIHFNRLGGENLLSVQRAEHHQQQCHAAGFTAAAAQATNFLNCFRKTEQGYLMVCRAGTIQSFDRACQLHAEGHAHAVCSELATLTVQHELPMEAVARCCLRRQSQQQADHSCRLQSGASEHTRLIRRLDSAAAAPPIPNLLVVQASYNAGFATLPCLADQAGKALCWTACICSTPLRGRRQWTTRRTTWKPTPAITRAAISEPGERQRAVQLRSAVQQYDQRRL
jgi:hypothetical protein